METKVIEINHNKLIIDIPKGVELDTENTDVTKGVIMLKKKNNITYEEVVEFGFSVRGTEIESKAQAIAKLINIAKYYNRDWKPNWSDIHQRKYCIIYNKSDDAYSVDYNTSYTYNNIYFSTKEDAISVIFNPNFKPILDAIYKE
jgi:hypothetical protein